MQGPAVLVSTERGATESPVGIVSLASLILCYIYVTFVERDSDLFNFRSMCVIMLLLITYLVYIR